MLNVFTDQKSSVSIFSPAFLAELERMKERNLAVEMLKTLLKEQLPDAGVGVWLRDGNGGRCLSS